MTSALLQQYEPQYTIAKLLRVNFDHMSDETINHFRKARNPRRDLAFHGLQSHPLTDQSLPIPTDLNQLIGFEEPLSGHFNELNQPSPASWGSEGGFDLTSCSSEKSSLRQDALSPFHGSPSLSERVPGNGTAPLIQSNLNSLDAFELSSDDWDFLNNDCWDLLDMSLPLQKESTFPIKTSRDRIPDELKHLDGIMVGWADPTLSNDSD